MNLEIDKKLYKNLFLKLPTEIIINHILPYTYEKQSPKLLNDIKSFYNDLNIIENYYYFEQNSSVLLNDIKHFINIPSSYERFEILHNNNNDDYKFIRKYVLKKHKKYYKIILNYSNTEIDRAIRKIIGLMTLIERTRFINKYIITD
jgi:hypothetical protein